MRWNIGLVFAFVVACSPSRQWPDKSPNVNTLKLTESAFEASKDLAQVVTVEKDRLLFPASAAEEVKAKWPVGKSVVGAPSSMAGTTNPLGFIRKVKEVRVEGDQVVVDTEPTTIDQIFDGELRLTMDSSEMTAPEVPEGVDLEKYLPAFPSGPATPFPDDLDALGITQQPLEDVPAAATLVPIGVKRQPLDLTTDRIDVPTVPITTVVALDRPIAFIKANGSPATARVQYRGRLTLNPNLSLTPRLRLELETKNCPFCSLESFLFSVGGSVKAGLVVDSEVSVEPHPDDARTLTTSDLSALDDAVVTLQPQPFALPEVLIGREKVKKVGTIYGVPVLLKTGVYGDCQFSLKGRYRGKVSVDLTNPSLTVGVQYSDSGPKKEKWVPVTPSRFTVTGSAQVVNASGSFEAECALTLKTTLTLADLAGPYAGVRNAVVGSLDFENVACPANPPAGVRKTGTVTPSIKAYSAIQVGAEVTLLKIISFGVGPFTLAEQLYKEGAPVRVAEENLPLAYRGTGLPFYKKEWEPLWQGPPATFPRAGFCPSTCTNEQKDANEAGVDCGGTCGATCPRGTACTTGQDCRSAICTGATCRGGLSDDMVLNQGETDVDCGGPTNAIRCGPGQLCTANSDCSPGFCGKPVGGERRCTENLCLDGVVSGAESDLDCGSASGCTSRCAVGQRCLSSADCTSGACSVSGVCVSDTCVDGIRNGTEADIDCGGSCARKCATGDACRPAVESDCASGICSASTSRCVVDRCLDGRTSANETDVDCGGTTCTQRCGLTARCLATSDCQAGNICNLLTGTCTAPGCSDGIKNGSESSIDCGGPTCLKCAVSKACTGNADCVTNTCTNGRCVGGPCENEVKDATEADVDCGGSCGRPCANGRSCAAPTDCASNLCVGSVCSTDACRDLTRNGAETGVDCGGATCAARCATGVACTVNGDCASGLCNLTTRLCAATTCSDGVLTAGSESDVDCGGSCANACAVNKRCATNTDCASGVCNPTSLRCVPDACFNGARDGNETDIDCGGSCEPKCGANLACAVNADCQSGVCGAGNRCAADQCSNARFDGTETDVDCGGTCATKCALTRGCLANTDCANPQGMVGVPGFCSLSTRACVATSCNTGARDGTETGVDCGGGTCATCGLGQGCNVNTDCASGICNATTRVCVATQCQDGVRNGTETDIDCGGATCGGCAVNSACALPWDCASGYCGAANLCIPAYPRTCINVPTEGMHIIDPDGPTPRVYASVPDRGHNKPILTYCSLPTPSGGWTPIYFVNSQGSLAMPAALDRSTRNGAAITSVTQCDTGNACPAGDTCVSTSGTTCTAPSGNFGCVCVGPGLWTNGPALATNPATLSVSTATASNHDTFSYASATSAFPAMGFAGAGGQYPSSYRWTGYRNGVLVFDVLLSPPFGIPNWLSRGQWVSVPANLNFNWNMCAADSTYILTPQASNPSLAGLAPYDDLEGGVRTIEGSCRRFGRNVAQQFSVGSLGTQFGVQAAYRVLPGPVNGLATAAAPHLGMWLAIYGSNNSTIGYPTHDIMPIQQSMGFCNGMSSASTTVNATVCNPYRHPSRDRNNVPVTFSWGANELSGDTSRGSEFGRFVPGLVFVLWAQ